MGMMCYGCEYVCVSTGASESQRHWLDFPRAGVMGTCEPPKCVLGTELCRISKYFYQWVMSPSPVSRVLKKQIFIYLRIYLLVCMCEYVCGIICESWSFLLLCGSRHQRKVIRPGVKCRYLQCISPASEPRVLCINAKQMPYFRITPPVPLNFVKFKDRVSLHCFLYPLPPHLLPLPCHSCRTPGLVFYTKLQQ